MRPMGCGNALSAVLGGYLAPVGVNVTAVNLAVGVTSRITGLYINSRLVEPRIPSRVPMT